MGMCERLRLAAASKGDETMNAAFTITEPREIIKALLKTFEDDRGWKYPIAAQRFTQEHLAFEVAAAMDFYYGGHEMTSHVNDAGETVYVVSSHGYYHYIGA
jgi:hypothetical protein